MEGWNKWEIYSDHYDGDEDGSSDDSITSGQYRKKRGKSGWWRRRNIGWHRTRSGSWNQGECGGRRRHISWLLSRRRERNKCRPRGRWSRSRRWQINDGKVIDGDIAWHNHRYVCENKWTYIFKIDRQARAESFKTKGRLKKEGERKVEGVRLRASTTVDLCRSLVCGWTWRRRQVVRSCSWFEQLQTATVHLIQGSEGPSDKHKSEKKEGNYTCIRKARHWFGIGTEAYDQLYLWPNSCVISAKARDGKSQRADPRPVHVVPIQSPRWWKWCRKVVGRARIPYNPNAGWLKLWHKTDTDESAKTNAKRRTLIQKW